MLRSGMVRLILALGFVFALAAPALAEPPTAERPHEILSERPSGFWTSNRPAVGGAYKYRLLGIGCVICALTGFLTYRLVKSVKGPGDRRPTDLRARLLDAATLPEHKITSVVVISSSERRTTP